MTKRIRFIACLALLSMLNPACKHTTQDPAKIYQNYVLKHLSHPSALKIKDL